ncbi:MAG: mgtC [Nevskia sp.]|nr:mgtC [Nevskia sp.]
MEPSGEGWLQIGELALAFVLSSAIGLERELKMRSAGLRTCTLIGIAAALITLVSKYGFGDVLHEGRIVLDPSRMAAQIVSGIGFIGGGLIFVRQDVARGLTTAATVWLVAGVGMACGAGLAKLAACVTLAHFVVVYAYTPLISRIQSAYCELTIAFVPGRDVLRQVIEHSASYGFSILDIVDGWQQGGKTEDADCVKLRLKGVRSYQPLLILLRRTDGILSVEVGQPGRDQR